MAKIDLPDNLLSGLVPGLSGRKPREERKIDKGKDVFRTLLRGAEGAESDGFHSGSVADAPYSQAGLETLLDDVHVLGESLKRDPNPQAVVSYKLAVRNFVHHVILRTYALEEKTSGTNILKRKKYVHMTVIDRKLESLAAEILSTQRSQMEILRRVDEIYGILVDLLQ
ncbi:MAG TPA: DUF327 family protein [Magnetospirillaceae bacterium]|nr:DUF327 family protein [Magnetospirillaceae bacterium]